MKINGFKRKIFPIGKEIHGKGIPLDLTTRLKILISKWMPQRLPIEVAQVKAGTTSENWLHKIRQIINYSLYQTSEIIQKVYNNIMNSKKL